jgi:hypothetical protein
MMTSTRLRGSVGSCRLGVAGTVPGDPLEIRRAMRAPVLLLDDLGKDAVVKSNPVPAIIGERHDAPELTSRRRAQ